ncbi:MAG: WD40/YVTN/BNR-like repeat-containing protein [Thermoplasmatota archaeon]
MAPALAGCTASPTQGPRVIPASSLPPPGLSFAPAVVVDKQTHGAEPSIAVDDRGTIYVASPTGPQSTLWRSRDGLSYQQVPISGAAASPLGGADNDVAVGSASDLYFVDDSAACLTVSASHDAGATWFTNPVACDAPLVDRPWITANGSTVWVTFQGFHRGATVLKSIDGGKTFPFRSSLTEIRVANEEIRRGDAGSGRGNIVYSRADGMLYSPGYNSTGVGVSVSKDGGLTWAWNSVATRNATAAGRFYPDIFTVLAVDAGGDLFDVWSEGRGNATDVWLASSMDKGETWSIPVKVNKDGGNHVLPWVAARADGEVAVAWYETATFGDTDTMNASAAWHVHAAVSRDARVARPLFVEAPVWTTPVATGPLWTSGGIGSAGQELGDFFQIAFDPRGHVDVAFTDGRAGGTDPHGPTSFVMFAQGMIP